MIEGRLLRLLTQCLVSHGVQADEFYPDENRGGGGWDGPKAVDLWTFAAALDGIAARVRPDFAFDFGRSVKVRNLGMAGCAMQSARTVQEAAEIWIDYDELAGFPTDSRFRHEGDRWIYEFTPRIPFTPRALQFWTDVTIGTMVGLSEQLAGAPSSLFHVHLPFKPAANQFPYELLGAAHLRYGAPSLMLAGPRADLDMRLETADEEAKDICLSECRTAIERHRRNQPWGERVLQALSASFGSLPTVGLIARQLGVSHRTLQRNLLLEGSSFRQVVSDFRANYARLLNRDDTIDTKSAAFRLGYSDVSSVYRMRRA